MGTGGGEGVAEVVGVTGAVVEVGEEEEEEEDLTRAILTVAVGVAGGK